MFSARHWIIKKVRLVFADISKAFDRVCHAGILHKLKNNGITGSLDEWFSDNRQKPMCCDKRLFF